VVEEVYDESALKCIAHVFSEAKSAIGPYSLEAFIVMGFDETGEKITKMDEMVDSAYLIDYLKRIEAAQVQSQ